MLRGSNVVPSSRPSDDIATQASGISVSTTAQWTSRCAWTPGAWTTAAIGNTITAASAPCTAPESTLAIATSQIGHGDWTRSSISRVYPNSVDICKATAWIPWNMIEIATTPGTSTVAKWDSATGPAPAPMPWPILGNP